MLAKLEVQSKYDIAYSQIHQSNNPISAYASHILNNKHEYGNVDRTIQLLKQWNKGNNMNRWESFSINIFQQQNILIEKEKVNDLNPLHFSQRQKTTSCSPIFTTV